MTPPAGKNAFKACRRITESVEEAGLEGDEAEVGDKGCLTSNGNNGRMAESVAVLRCWLGVRKQTFKAEISPSISKSCNFNASLSLLEWA